MTSVTGLSRATTTAGARVVANRAELIVTGVFYLMVTSVLAGLWFRAAGAAGGSIVGYSATALVWYVATTEAAVMSLPFRLVETVGDDIGSGRVEAELLRPISALWLRVGVEVGAMLPRLAICVVLGASLATWIGGPPIDGLALALAAPSLLLAVTVNLLFQHGFAAAAFWFRDAKGTWFLYQKMVFVVGGMLLPLEVMPRWLELGAKALPFMAVAYAPARLASGHVEPWLLAVQAFWLVVLAVGATRVFAAGERRLATGRA